MTPPTNAAMDCAKELFPDRLLDREKYYQSKAAIIDKHFPQGERVRQMEHTITICCGLLLGADVNERKIIREKLLALLPKQPKDGA